MCFTYGQWLHMKITSRPAEARRSSLETVFPETVSRNRKSGALVPRGNIVEFTATMGKMLNRTNKLSNTILFMNQLRWRRRWIRIFAVGGEFMEQYCDSTDRTSKEYFLF